MSYLVLARKYRPNNFDQFVGQEVIAETLRNAIRLERVAHAYLFCGPRGVGKTSMARVFAKALNCVNGPTPDPCGECDRCQGIASGQDVDVIEIDGASNRGIEEIREIRQNVRYAAARSRFKIYYIDEVHMLTEHAFNALLKTLEEPPPHVKFLLATTAPAKLPETIISRVQRFDFRRISNAAIHARLKDICKAEGVDAPDDVLLLVARRARGSMRDALSLLDQVFSFCGEKLKLEEVARLLGALGDGEMGGILQMILAKDAAALIQRADALLGRGIAVSEIIDQFVGYVRDLLVGRLCGADQDLLDRPAESAAAIAKAAREMSPDHLLYIGQALNEARRLVRQGQDDRIVLEMALVKLAQSDGLAPLGEIVERLVALEESLDAAESPPIVREPSSQPRYSAGSGGVRVTAPPAPASRADRSPSERPASARNAEAPADERDVWTRVLEAVHNRSSWLYVKLAMAHLQRLDGKEAVVAFPADRPSIRAEMEQPESRRELEKVFAQVVGRPVRVHVVCVSGVTAAKTPQETAAKDEMIQEVLRRFDGQIVSS